MNAPPFKPGNTVSFIVFCSQRFPTGGCGLSAGCLYRTLSSPADAAAVASHGDGLNLGDNVLEELLSPLELPAIDGLGGLAGVLERNTEVRPAGASRLRRGNLSRCVPSLKVVKKDSQSAHDSQSIAKFPKSPERATTNCALQNRLSNVILKMKNIVAIAIPRFQNRRGPLTILAAFRWADLSTKCCCSELIDGFQFWRAKTDFRD